MAKRDEIKQQLTNGTFSDTKLTVKAYLEQWIEQVTPQLKARTVDDYRYEIDKYIVPRIGGVRLDKFKPLHVQAMMSELAKAVSEDRANKSRRVLNGALKQAVRWQLITRNPVKASDPLKHEREEMRIWSLEDAARFLDAIRGHRLYALFYLAMSAGLRRGELLGLRWQDIGDDHLWVRQSVVERRGKLIISTPKTKKGYRRVKLSPDVMDVLAEHRKLQESERTFLGDAWPDTDLVFTSTVGTFLAPRSLLVTYHRLQERAREKYLEGTEEGTPEREARTKDLETGRVLPHARLHDLRHLNVSLRRALRQDAKLIADQVGHTDPAFTFRQYSHLFEEERDGAAIDLKQALGQPGASDDLN